MVQQVRVQHRVHAAGLVPKEKLHITAAALEAKEAPQRCGVGKLLAADWNLNIRSLVDLHVGH